MTRGSEAAASPPDWVERMRRWAGESDRVVVVARSRSSSSCTELLPVDPARIDQIANGVDTDVFAPEAANHARTDDAVEALPRRRATRLAAGLPGGSIRYRHRRSRRPSPIATGARPGRAVRRPVHELQAAATADRGPSRDAIDHRRAGRCWWWPAGSPASGRASIPTTRSQRLGAEGVFFVGWRDHDDLPSILTCSDVFAAPSVDEPFGLVYLEAMASGVPPIATCTGGPLSFINVDPARPTGWLVPPDDLAATTTALTEAVSNRRAARSNEASEPRSSSASTIRGPHPPGHSPRSTTR